MIVHVAVAAIVDAQGRVLIAKRPDHVHQGGFWEFPGGKVEEGESLQAALCRELEEELGIQAKAFQPLIQISHDYGDKHVLLDVCKVTAFDGEPHGVEGQPIKWVPANALAQHEFPKANRPIISALNLPDYYAITPQFANQGELFAYLKGKQGQPMVVQIRQPDWAPETLLQSVNTWCEQDDSGDSLLVVNLSPEFADQLPEQTGWHMPARHLGEALKGVQRKPWSVSCHSQRELKLAESLGVQCVLLSPVKLTKQYNSEDLLGWNVFAEWVQTAKLPVYALGGLSKEDLYDAKRLGGQGVAGISAFK